MTLAHRCSNIISKCFSVDLFLHWWRIIAGRGEMFLWGRGYNDAPDFSQPRLAHIGLKLCQVSLGWRHGLALAGNASLSIRWR